MINHDRRKALLKILSEDKTATVDQLVERLGVSPATVRRDIKWLMAANLLVRTRGGAQGLAGRKPFKPLSSATFQANIQNQVGAKRAIARAAAGLCHDDETIIINGGTTTYMMAEFLADKRLKILTNSFLMAKRLLATSENEIIIPGGKVYREQNVILSPFDNDITQHHFAARMFTGVHAISMLGLMEADPLLIEAEKRLITQAEDLVVLADSSKFARKAGLRLCGLERIATVITDSGIPDKAAQVLEQFGARVIVVDPEPEPEPAVDAA